MGAQTQRTTHLQDGCPNEKPIRNENVHTREHYAKIRAGGWIRTNFGLEVDFLIWPQQGWAPQCNARRVSKMGAQTQHKARPQVGRPQGNKLATQGTSASWAPQCNARHIRKLGTPQRTSATQMQGTSTRPQVGQRPTQRKARPQDGRPNENSSATKTSTQGSTRLKDELEDG
jgi:hypothetical protein